MTQRHFHISSRHMKRVDTRKPVKYPYERTFLVQRRTVGLAVSITSIHMTILRVFETTVFMDSESSRCCQQEGSSCDLTNVVRSIDPRTGVRLYVRVYQYYIHCIHTRKLTRTSTSVRVFLQTRETIFSVCETCRSLRFRF